MISKRSRVASVASAVALLAATVAQAEPADPRAWSGIRLSPEVGVGWLTEERGATEPDTVFRYGLGFACQSEALQVRVAARHQLQERTYLGGGPALNSPGLASVPVNEHAIEGEVGAWYDLGPVMGVSWRAFSLVLGGGFLARQLVNDVFPATIAGVDVGAGLALDVAPGLRFGADVDYTHNLGRFMFEGTDSAFGAHLGYLRYGATLKRALGGGADLGVAYRGSWIALEHADAFDHSIVLNLSLAWAK